MISLFGSAAAWPLAARAQEVGKVPRIGYLSPGSATPGPLAYHDEFRRGLRELGYVEERNIVIEYRFADGNFDRLAQLAAELVQLNVDVIVSVVTQASLAAKNATRTIPIVIVSVGDPVGAGLVASLARPGANVTGTSAMTTEVIGKSLELFKQTVSKVSPIAASTLDPRAGQTASSARPECEQRRHYCQGSKPHRFCGTSQGKHTEASVEKDCDASHTDLFDRPPGRAGAEGEGEIGTGWLPVL